MGNQELARKPGINEKTLAHILLTGKTFFSTRQNTHVDKWELHFSDGYIGELLLKKDSLFPYKVGQILQFRVGFRNNLGDEIEILSSNTAKQEEQRTVTIISSMNGHPATIAMGMAKEIVVANGTIKKKVIEFAELKTAADEIYEWLTDKRDYG